MAGGILEAFGVGLGVAVVLGGLLMGSALLTIATAIAYGLRIDPLATVVGVVTSIAATTVLDVLLVASDDAVVAAIPLGFLLGVGLAQAVRSRSRRIGVIQGEGFRLAVGGVAALVLVAMALMWVFLLFVLGAHDVSLVNDHPAELVRLLGFTAVVVGANGYILHREFGVQTIAAD